MYDVMYIDYAIPGPDRSEMPGKRLLDMSPEELDAVFDAAIERAGAVE